MLSTDVHYSLGCLYKQPQVCSVPRFAPSPVDAPLPSLASSLNDLAVSTSPTAEAVTEPYCPGQLLTRSANLTPELGAYNAARGLEAARDVEAPLPVLLGRTCGVAFGTAPTKVQPQKSVQPLQRAAAVPMTGSGRLHNTRLGAAASGVVCLTKDAGNDEPLVERAVADVAAAPNATVEAVPPATETSAAAVAAWAAAGPLLGSPALPTLGSSAHSVGKCKPCAFVYKEGCESGVECKFCHLCQAGEKKRRKKDRKEARRVIRQQQWWP